MVILKQGGWDDGEFEGEGTYSWGSGIYKGDIYIGNWLNDKRHKILYKRKEINHVICQSINHATIPSIFSLPKKGKIFFHKGKKMVKREKS